MADRLFDHVKARFAAVRPAISNLRSG